MKKLLLALVAVSTLFLTACSSCLGTTPTPGEAAPQADAPDDTQSMVSSLDSLLKAGDGAKIYAILANVSEKMMEVTDTAKAREYLMELNIFISAHQEELTALAKSSSDAVTKQELPGLVTFFSDINMLQTVYGFVQPAADMAENVAGEGALNAEN